MVAEGAAGAGSPAGGEIRLDALSVVFGRGANALLAVDRVSASVAAGEFVCLLGPSGCGKSTVMNVIAGFEVPSQGRVTLDGEPVTGPGPDRGMVFQKPTLFPWKSVRDNVAHGPRMQGLSTKEARKVADEFLALVGLRAFANSRPDTLSGGMQQRVGIARALTPRPKVLLMDEPFGALDAQTRSMMQENLLRIWVEQRPTVVFVTHDIDEAIFLADRVLIMSARPGRIVEEITVTLPRPRDPSVLLTPEFLAIKQLCYAPVRRESLRSFEQGSSVGEGQGSV
ncbi:MAG: ABC transporter ATP-binding protein [Pseudomonadota bacterium]